jgi:hypothetical protein
MNFLSDIHNTAIHNSSHCIFLYHVELPELCYDHWYWHFQKMCKLSDYYHNCLDEASRGFESMSKVIQYANEQFMMINILDLLFFNHIIIKKKLIDCLFAIPLVVISNTGISSDGNYSKWWCYLWTKRYHSTCEWLSGLFPCKSNCLFLSCLSELSM